MKNAVNIEEATENILALIDQLWSRQAVTIS